MRRSGLVLVCLLASAQTGVAQEPVADVDDLEPAVNTSRGSFETALEAAPAAQEPPQAIEAPAAAEPAPSSAGGSKTAGGYRAIDELDLGTTSITGNQELPKVLYIIPWKNSDLGDLVGRPVNTLLDEVLAPVDPEVFRRQLDYYDTLYGESQEE
jgi:hypothetical protein